MLFVLENLQKTLLRCVFYNCLELEITTNEGDQEEILFHLEHTWICQSYLNVLRDLTNIFFLKQGIKRQN